MVEYNKIAFYSEKWKNISHICKEINVIELFEYGIHNF